MVENKMVAYWRKVRTRQEEAMDAQRARERRYAESGDVSVLEGREPDDSRPDGGEWMMSLENEDRGTLGGRVSSIPWANQCVGRKLADKTHRIATAEEITKFKREQAERQARYEREQERLDRRNSIFIKPLAPLGKAK